MKVSWSLTAASMARCALRFVIVVALASATAAQSARWKFDPDATWPLDASRRALEPYDSGDLVGSDFLELRSNELFRRQGAEEEKLVITNATKTGVLRCFARSANGSLYVGADNGLFVCHPTTATLDRVKFADGAPEGQIIGLHCDGDRLFVLTDIAFGCVHTSQWFGQVHDQDSGIPAGPYLGLRIRDGEFLLRTQVGVWSYRPTNERPDAPAVRLASSAPGDSALDPKSTGTSVHYRYRSASHHMLRPLRDHEIELEYPGLHEILLYAFDRDLQRSEPQLLSLELPYPAAYSPRILVTGVVAVCISIFALVVIPSIRRASLKVSSRRGELGRATLSAALLCIVSLQIFAAVLGHGRSYPFIGFSMYSQVYQENQVIFTPRVFARSNGKWQSISAGPLSFATDGMWRHLAELQFAEHSERQSFLTERSRALGRQFDAFEARILRCRLTPLGPRDVAPLVVAAFDERVKMNRPFDVDTTRDKQ